MGHELTVEPTCVPYCSKPLEQEVVFICSTSMASGDAVETINEEAEISAETSLEDDAVFIDKPALTRKINK